MDEEDVDDYLDDDCPWCGTLYPQGESIYTWDDLVREGFDPVQYRWVSMGL